MSGPKVPAALLERLGEDAGAALTAMISAHDKAQVEYVVKQCSERFERRLVEETSTLRVEMIQLGSDIRGELARFRTEFRGELTSLREEMASGRFELIKWVFMFWIGQVATIFGLLAVLLRARG
jgi:hypothetical protein